MPFYDFSFQMDIKLPGEKSKGSEDSLQRILFQYYSLTRILFLAIVDFMRVLKSNFVYIIGFGQIKQRVH